VLTWKIVRVSEASIIYIYIYIYRLAVNPCIARDNYFYGGFTKKNLHFKLI